MDLLIGLAGRDHLAEEVHEVLTRMLGRCPALNLAGLNVRRRVERQRAVSLVLEPVPLDATRRERQHAVPVERLDGRLLVDVEDRGVARPVQVEADDVGRLRLEVRVVRHHVAGEPMGLQVCFAPDALHEILTHARAGGEAAAGPVRRPVRRRAARRGQHPGTHTCGQLPRRPPGIVAPQAVHVTLQRPPAPLRDGRARDVELRRSTGALPALHAEERFVSRRRRVRARPVGAALLSLYRVCDGSPRTETWADCFSAAA